MTRSELINSKEYWITKIQMELYDQVEKYLKEQNISQTTLAEKLGVSKAYISQILNGDFNHKISTLVELSLAIGKAPTITFNDIEKTENNTQTHEIPAEPVKTQPTKPNGTHQLQRKAKLNRTKKVIH